MATKQFIGSGKAHSQFDSVTVTIKAEEALKYAYEREHGKFITFVLSRRQSPDNYGRTHSAFVLVQDPDAKHELAGNSSEPVAKPKNRKKKSNLSPSA